AMAAADSIPRCAPVRDAIASSDPLAAPVRPPHCAVTTQTPPDFTWPAFLPPPPAAAAGDRALPAPAAPKGEYVVTLHHPGGRTESLKTPHNWVAWKAALPAGDYRWTVTLPDGRRGE